MAASRIGKALRYAHAYGNLHRDCHPHGNSYPHRYSYGDSDAD
jgi:hypothetical protein